MSATAAPAAGLLTADEFARRYAGRRVELVLGRVVEVPVSFPKHGKVCHRVSQALGNFVDAHDLGHVVINDSWVVVERDPDTARGPDVAFFSYARLPKGPIPDGLLPVVPELVFEVRSPTDRWTRMIAKMLEYTAAGVAVVVILDPKTASASVFRSDDRQDIFEAGDELTLPDILPGFSVPVRKFFE
ncbi:MAG: Uma2 family endonuclease [Gemmataceae bacterium]|nr:Uma2 family endonuclease [Gemmataceae bacterium]